MEKKNWLIFLGFLALAFCLRLPSFFQSTLDWDESLYILMADSLVNGHPPYTEVWDNKPPGIYVLFSTALILFGDSIVSIRILACIAVAITSYLLYQIGNIISKGSVSVGLLAGVIYTISSLTSGGNAANTEIFFTPFVVLAFLVFFSNKSYANFSTKNIISKAFIIGLSLGIGLQIKQVVIFDLITILLITAYNWYLQLKKNQTNLYKKALYFYLALFTGFLLPAFIVLIYFILNGLFDEYFYANFTANLIRGRITNFSLTPFLVSLVAQILRYPLLWASFSLAFLYLLLKRLIPEKRNILTALVIWVIIVFPGILYTKSFYPHYFLQLLPPLSLITSYTINLVYLERERLNRFIKILAIATLSLGFIPMMFLVIKSFKNTGEFVNFRFVKGQSYWGDEPAKIAEYIQPRIKENDYIYIADGEIIIYYLVNAKMPTKYVFYDFVLSKELSKVAGVNPMAELKSILQKKPVYIIKKNSEASSKVDNSTIDKRLKQLTSDVGIRNKIQEAQLEIDSYLSKYYVLETSFEDLNLYKLKTRVSSKNGVK